MFTTIRIVLFLIIAGFVLPASADDEKDFWEKYKIADEDCLNIVQWSNDYDFLIKLFTELESEENTIVVFKEEIIKILSDRGMWDVRAFTEAHNSDDISTCFSIIESTNNFPFLRYLHDTFTNNERLNYRTEILTFIQFINATTSGQYKSYLDLLERHPYILEILSIERLKVILHHLNFDLPDNYAAQRLRIYERAMELLKEKWKSKKKRANFLNLKYTLDSEGHIQNTVRPEFLSHNKLLRSQRYGEFLGLLEENEGKSCLVILEKHPELLKELDLGELESLADQIQNQYLSEGLAIQRQRICDRIIELLMRSPNSLSLTEARKYVATNFGRYFTIGEDNTKNNKKKKSRFSISFSNDDTLSRKSLSQPESHIVHSLNNETTTVKEPQKEKNKRFSLLPKVKSTGIKKVKNQHNNDTTTNESSENGIDFIGNTKQRRNSKNSKSKERPISRSFDSLFAKSSLAKSSDSDDNGSPEQKEIKQKQPRKVLFTNIIKRNQKNLVTNLGTINETGVVISQNDINNNITDQIIVEGNESCQESCQEGPAWDKFAEELNSLLTKHNLWENSSMQRILNQLGKLSKGKGSFTALSTALKKIAKNNFPTDLVNLFDRIQKAANSK